MNKLNLTALLLGAALFTGLGAVSLSASDDMKCGAGKCGSSMKKPMKKEGDSKCGAGMKKEGMKCGAAMKEMQEKKEKKKSSMKCGKGKCGAN